MVLVDFFVRVFKEQMPFSVVQLHSECGICAVDLAVVADSAQLEYLGSRCVVEGINASGMKRDSLLVRGWGVRDRCDDLTTLGGANGDIQGLQGSKFDSRESDID